MSNRTLIYYVIPEDDDDFEHPNVFAIHKSVKQLTIGEVVEAFPLPGVYHFRFKTAFMKTFVWEDGVKLDGDSLYYFQAIHQESDVIPENVDAIRALMGIEADWKIYVEKTDSAIAAYNGL